MEKSDLDDIEKEIEIEYGKINSQWLDLHFKTSVGIFIASFFIEIILGIVMCNSVYLTTTVPNFILKFIIIPISINFVCIMTDVIVLRSHTISQEKKVYIVSLMFVVISFVLFTVHVIFSNLYFIFALPILLTIVYANYRLTIDISIISLVGLTTSELFIKWDLDKVNILTDSLTLVNFIISIIILIAFSTVSMVVIRFYRKKNAVSIQKEVDRQQLQKKLQIDELTGVYNRRALHDMIKEIDADRSDNSYIFVMLDIDNFKTLNDTFGHMVGDSCLKQMGYILKRNCEDGTPFRYGGDEFCILFRNASMENAVSVCKKISEEWQGIVIDNNVDIKLTASIGISENKKHMDTESLILSADEALYAAKSIKNTIHIYSGHDLQTI